MVETSEIRYATGAGGIDIAWQEFGLVKGPRLVFIPGFISHLELNLGAASYRRTSFVGWAVHAE